MHAVLATIILTVAACGKDAASGSCEFAFSKTSVDGSIRRGDQSCFEGTAAACNAEGAGLASTGIETGNYVFKASKSCTERGYTKCDEQVPMWSRECPK